MLILIGQRRRRWSSNEWMLVGRPVFAEMTHNVGGNVNSSNYLIEK